MKIIGKWREVYKYSPRMGCKIGKQQGISANSGDPAAAISTQRLTLWPEWKQPRGRPALNASTNIGLSKIKRASGKKQKWKLWIGERVVIGPYAQDVTVRAIPGIG